MSLVSQVSVPKIMSKSGRVLKVLRKERLWVRYLPKFITKLLKKFLVFAFGGQWLLAVLQEVGRFFFWGVEATGGLKGDLSGDPERRLWSCKFCKESKGFFLAGERNDTKRLELKFGRPQLQQIQETEELARVSKIWEFMGPRAASWNKEYRILPFQLKKLRIILYDIFRYSPTLGWRHS